MFAQSIVRCKQRMKQRTLLHLLPEVPFCFARGIHLGWTIRGLPELPSPRCSADPAFPTALSAALTLLLA